MKKNNDFTKIFTKIHKNKWVALSSNRSKVLAYDEKFADLVKKVNDVNAVYMKVPPRDIFFAFTS
jgi:hypothetical protein